MTRWKSEAVSNLPQVFESENSKLRKQAKELEAQVEELSDRQVDHGAVVAQKNLVSEYTSRERLEMMSQEDKISIRQQAELLGVNRSGFYYRPVPPDPMDLYIKRLEQST